MSCRRPPTGGGGHGHYANGAGVVLYVPDVIAMESELPDHSALDPIITSMPTMPRVPLQTLRRRVCLGVGWGGSAASPPIWTPAIRHLSKSGFRAHLRAFLKQ